MALVAPPPWTSVNPLDFVNAASSGAKLGLERAAQDSQNMQAADRIRLAYAELGQRANDSAANSAAQSAANALHQQAQQQALNQWMAEQDFNKHKEQFAETNTLADNARLDKGQTLMQQQHQDVVKATQDYRDKQLGLGDRRAKAAEDSAKSLSDWRTTQTDLATKRLVPSAVRLTDEIIGTEKQANDLEAAGNKPAADQLRERSKLLREQTHGNEIVTGYDDQGRPIIKMGKGVGGSPTVATASQAQQKLLRYENTLELLNHLTTVLKPEHLGAAGVTGEYIMDRGLSQLVPELANKDRVDARSTLIAAREGLMREISNDPRFSNMDREEISKALPSTGIFESLPDAEQRISTIRNILTQRAKTYSQGLGEEAPLWSLPKEELLKLYQEGKVDPKKALDVLTRFH